MVEWKKLDDCLDFEQPTPYLVNSTEYDDSYEIPVLTAGQSLLLGYTNETEGIYKASKENPTIIFDDFTTSFHWIDFNFKVKSSAMKMLRPKKDVNFRYVYYSMCGINFIPGGHQRHWISKYSQFEIPIPSLSEQTRIVGILDTFTASIENLKQQIAERRKQYEYYRDQLLDLEGKEGVEMKYLLDVLAQPVTDGPHETPSFFEDGIPFISADAIVDNKINFSRKRGYISEEYDLLCQKKYKPQLNDIYLVKSGSTTGKVAIVRTDERFNIWSPLAAIRVNQRNHPYFVYYMLQTKKVQDQVKLKSSQGSQPNLSMRVLEKFIIPVPPLSEQQRIVSILDTFEASIQNLEAQLKQREKQYEYYRNKLLTFERYESE